MTDTWAELNQGLEGDRSPSTWLMVIYETLFSNRAVTGIAVSRSGSSVFTTSQGRFSYLKGGLPGITNVQVSWLGPGLYLHVLPPREINFEQLVCCVFCNIPQWWAKNSNEECLPVADKVSQDLGRARACAGTFPALRAEPHTGRSSPARGTRAVSFSRSSLGVCFWVWTGGFSSKSNSHIVNVLHVTRGTQKPCSGWLMGLVTSLMTHWNFTVLILQKG